MTRRRRITRFFSVVDWRTSSYSAVVAVLAGALAAVAFALPAAARRHAGPRLIVMRADAAIGPVRLGETRRAVERHLGAGGQPGGYANEYQLHGVRVTVRYANDRVAEVRAFSPRIKLYGQPLANETRSLQTLRRRHWQIKSCSPYTVAQHFAGHASSSVVWRSGRLFLAGVTSQGGIDVCPVGSPVPG